MQELDGRFICIKRDDLKYLPENLRGSLALVIWHISNGRKRDGKSGWNRYIVINMDEPYANDVLRLAELTGNSVTSQWLTPGDRNAKVREDAANDMHRYLENSDNGD